MGAWGAGVFDNDSALDLRGEMDEISDPDAIEEELLGELSSAMTNGIEIEDTDMLLAAVALLHELYERGKRPPAWLNRMLLRQQMLEAYDREIDELGATADYKSKRRPVMVDTLNRFCDL